MRHPTFFGEERQLVPALLAHVLAARGNSASDPLAYARGSVLSRCCTEPRPSEAEKKSKKPGSVGLYRGMQNVSRPLCDRATSAGGPSFFVQSTKNRESRFFLSFSGSGRSDFYHGLLV